MFTAGSSIILSESQADSHSHIVYLSMSPAASLSPLKKRKRGGEKKETMAPEQNKWCSTGGTQGRTVRRHQDRTHREETHRDMVQPKVIQGQLATFPSEHLCNSKVAQQQTPPTATYEMLHVKHVAQGKKRFVTHNPFPYLIRAVMNAIPPFAMSKTCSCFTAEENKQI